MSLVPTVSRMIVSIGRSRGGADHSMSPSVGKRPTRSRSLIARIPPGLGAGFEQLRVRVAETDEAAADDLATVRAEPPLGDEAVEHLRLLLIDLDRHGSIAHWHRSLLLRRHRNLGDEQVRVVLAPGVDRQLAAEDV